MENKIWKFIDKHLDIIILIIIVLLSLYARFILLNYQSGDYDIFLKNWFNELKAYGGLMGLSKNIGNYTPIYMTILSLLTYLPIDSLYSIKFVSIIFDYVGGFFLYKIILELFKNQKSNRKIAIIGYGLYLFLPTVILNASYWAQADSIYTAFIIISLYYLIKNNFVKGIIFFSISLAFKFQAIFIFPLYVLMYIANRKLKFKYFLIIPLVIFIMGIPKMIFSHNLLECFKVYFDQSNTYSQYITLNFPNFYSIFFKGNNSNLIITPIKEMGTIGIIITFVILGIIAYLVYNKKIKFEKTTIIEFGLWSILITTFFLPQMHERYLFMGDVIGIFYLLLNKNKYYIPLGIELVSLYGYFFLLFSGFSLNIFLVSIFNFSLLLIYSRNMYLKYFN